MTLAFFAVLFCCAANAEILKVKGNRVLIRLSGKTVMVGEQLDVVDAIGGKAGVVQITSVDKTQAIAEIVSGNVGVGMKLSRSNRVIVEHKSAPQIASGYSYDFRVNPIGLITGAIDANLDFKISRDWTVGVQGAYLQVSLSPSGIFNSNYKITAWGIGARANWFANGAFKTGLYLGPSLEYLALTIKTTDIFGPASGTAAGVMASALVGYGWFWQHLNFMLGGGYGSVLGASGITIKDSVGNQQTITASLSGLTYELSIGWAF